MVTKDAIPAGSEVPVSGQAPTVEVAPTPEAAAEVTPEVTPEPEKTPDITAKLQEQLDNAQKLIGRQGQELGTLRKSYEALSAQMVKETDKGQEPDIEAQLREIQAKVDSGDMDFGEALVATTKLGAQLGATQANDTWQNSLKQNQQREMQSKFLADHPDFTELADSGALDEIIAKNPLHDHVSAYFALKSDQRRAEMENIIAKANAEKEEAAKKAREEGVQEGAKLASASKQAAGVIGKAGQVQPTTTERRMTPAERQENMLAALRAAKSGGG